MCICQSSFKAPYREENCSYLLSPCDIWNADDGAVQDVGVAEEVGLHLQGANLEAACLDDVHRRSADNFKTLALSEARRVARSKPAIVCEFFGSCFGLVEVAAKHRRALDQQLSFHLKKFKDKFYG